MLQDDAVKLDDIVVVGYGTMKKRDLSGAVAKISGDDLLGTGASSFNQALQGKVSGVVVNKTDGAPGGAISINVRGANSFTTSTEPLYIVDGVPFETAGTPSSKATDGSQMRMNALASINPHDIESLEILKDASATAIYGSRGANGVVLITTKKGKAGRGKIEFTSNLSMSNVLKKIDVLDPVTYARYINEQTANRAIYNGETTNMGTKRWCEAPIGKTKSTIRASLKSTTLTFRVATTMVGGRFRVTISTKRALSGVRDLSVTSFT